MVSEEREGDLYRDIWCVMVAQGIHEVLLSEHGQKQSSLP